MKKFVSLLLALVMVLSLAACGGQPAGDNSQAPEGENSTAPEGAQFVPYTYEDEAVYMGALKEYYDFMIESQEITDVDEMYVAQAKAEAAEWQDKYLRLHAEWDTYRRRTNEQRAQEKARATEKLVESLLPVLDDFERTIDYATSNGESGLLGGVEAVHSKLVSVLEKDGVEVISPEGQAFDALEAQAVATVDDPSVPDETVAQVYQKGYRMGTKVLRPAMVTVTTGGPKREAEEAPAE